MKINSDVLYVNRTSWDLYEYKTIDAFIKEFINPSHSIFLNFLAPRLVSSTEAHSTILRWNKFVNKVGSTVFHKNTSLVFATCSSTITKANFSRNFTIFYGRMSTHQPAWPVCTTFECRHTRCWHFCSCSSHKTIPSLTEPFVTQRRTTEGCRGTPFSVSICLICVVVTTIG